MENAETALAMLDSRQLLPLATRLDAASWLEAAIGERIDAGPLNFDAEAVPLLCSLVPSLLGSRDEELTDALVVLLQRLLSTSPPRACALLCSLAEAEIERAENQSVWAREEGGDDEAQVTPQQVGGLAAALALALNVDLQAGAVAAANALTERPRLIAAILRGIEGEASIGASPIAEANARQQAQQRQALSDCYTDILIRMLQAHGASPSSILARCDVPLARLLNLLPSGAPGSANGAAARPQPSVQLLELFAHLSADESFVQQLCSSRLLGAIKPTLLSGRLPLQLASVDLLTRLVDQPEAGNAAVSALCSADIVAFLIELCRRDASFASQAVAAPMAADDEHELAVEQQFELRRAVRELLSVLLIQPNPSAGPIYVGPIQLGSTPLGPMPLGYFTSKGLLAMPS